MVKFVDDYPRDAQGNIYFNQLIPDAWLAPVINGNGSPGKVQTQSKNVTETQYSQMTEYEILDLDEKGPPQKTHPHNHRKVTQKATFADADDDDFLA